MELYLTATALVFIALILVLTLGDQSKVMGGVLTLATCCIVCISAVHYLEPALQLLQQLKQLAQISSESLAILLKTAGIALISELASLVCLDAGQAALGKAAQLLATSVILWLSIPLVEQLVLLLQEVL